MGQLALLLLVGALLPVGGSADDPAALTTVELSEAGASLEASTDQAVDAELAVKATAEDPSLAVQAADISIQADEQHLLLSSSDELLTLPVALDLLPAPEGVVVEIQLTSDDGEAEPSTMEELVLASTPTTESPSMAEALLHADVTAAAAAAALAATHLRPSARGIRRFLPLIPLYTRINRDEVLDHETRAAVYSLLKERPGLSLQEISEELDLSRSTARHHLRVLEDADMIGHRAQGRCRVHFPVGRRSEAVREHLLSHPTRQAIVEMVHDEPRSLVEMARELEANPGAVAFHLDKLTEAGLIERYENGSVTYRPGTTFRRV